MQWIIAHHIHQQPPQCGIWPRPAVYNLYDLQRQSVDTVRHLDQSIHGPVLHLRNRQMLREQPCHGHLFGRLRVIDEIPVLDKVGEETGCVS